tara:strand:+ start:5886 stop:6821 length:936 start_codon:yes stop_codon:yes gene_type:complete
MKIIPFNDENNAWDILVKNSHMGTFLHTRKYLSYHKDRFIDKSFLVFNKEELVGILPIAEVDYCTVSSHPGLSYGGLVHDGSVIGQKSIDIFSQVISEYKKLGYKKLLYKPIPSIYSNGIHEDDKYALLKLGAKISSYGISSTKNIKKYSPNSKRRTRGIAKAISNNVKVTRGYSLQELEIYWKILEDNLKLKYNTNATHSIEEITELQKKFPNNIELWYAHYRDEMIAGVLLYKTPNVTHMQYSASNDIGREKAATDYLIDECIDTCRTNYFDFGISTEDKGHILNNGLYTYKAEFGAFGTINYEYELIF